MPYIRIVTEIAAPIELCFDLARDIDFHTQSLGHTSERAVAGRTLGLIELGETVTWEGRHFGVRQQFTSKITAFDRPAYFRDKMVAGAFKEFVHDHRFESTNGRTAMIDEVWFRSPVGPLGRLINWLFLTTYMRRLLEGRAEAIKREAEKKFEPRTDTDETRKNQSNK
jgi:ligand-binding SRPBCC domain-containing protein